MNRRLRLTLLAAPALVWVTAFPARALDILSDDERAEKAREEKRGGKPVLACSPASLSTTSQRGDTAELSVVIKNAGGRVLRWSFGKLPRWLAADVTSGELKYKEQSRITLHVRTRLVSGGGDEAGIVIEAPGAEGSPLTIPIAVAVEEPEPAKPAPEKPKPVVRGPGPEPEAALSPPVPGGGGRGKIAVRVGFMLPGSGSKTGYDSSPFFGVQYRMPRKESSKLSYEIGVERASSDAEGVGASSQLTTGRADVLFHVGGGNGGAWYLMSGLGGMIDKADLPGASESYKVGLLDLGAGMGLAGGKLDVRLSHSLLLGSENVGGMTQLSMAYSF